jgi:hypothetical protein
VSENVELFSAKHIKDIKGLGYVIVSEVTEDRIRPIDYNASLTEEPLRLALYKNHFFINDEVEISLSWV